jgi:hypothetical protein
MLAADEGKELAGARATTKRCCGDAPALGGRRILSKEGVSVSTRLDFRVHGVVREAETDLPVPRVRVRAYDKDLLFDDLLGETATDDQGEFEVRYAGSDFQELFDSRPDIYFRVYDETGSQLLLDSADSVRWDAGADEVLDLVLPRHHLPGEQGIRLVDGHGHAVRELEAGESLLLAAEGLRPATSHRVQVRADDGTEVLSVSVLSDRYGTIAPTGIWPDVGIGDPDDGGPFAFATFEEAAQALAGRTFTLEVSAGEGEPHRASFQLGGDLTRPRLYSATEHGAPRRGLLLGEDELRVVAQNLPRGALVDLYLVPRQSDWRPGDPILPVRDASGAEVLATVQLGEDERGFNDLLWPADRLLPGGYDLIARLVEDHEYLREERVLRSTDLVSDRFLTSLVVREDIFRYKPIYQGCVMAVEVAGHRLTSTPYFQFTDNFPVGTDVWATLDPAGLMPQKIGKKIRYYVTQHKDALGWSNNPAAVDVNGSDIEAITASSCVNVAEMLVWPNPQVPGKYDLVVDFGNNDPNPANFVSDGQFNPPLDMIDGAIRVGFYVTEDPAVAGVFPVGQTSFNDGPVTIPAVGVWSPWGTLGNTMSGTLSLPLVAEVRYPATVAGVNTPVSSVNATYPVVLLMHGMHTTADPSYQGYGYLLDHFASRGYIALSIDVNAINAINGMQDTRGHAVIEHLTLLQSKNQNPGLFQGKIDMSRIAIMGHSRGGDGVVQAEIYNQALGANKFDIKGVIPLSPTDFSGASPNTLVLSTSKFLCVYGGNDGDVWGGSSPSTDYAGTGFRFYDRATVEKAFVFIPAATHNRFNTLWGTEVRVDAASPKVLTSPQHELLLKGYMTAFLQAIFDGRTEQLDYFKGEIKLPQATGLEVHTSYRVDPVTTPRTVDDFETNPATNQSSIGGAVSSANLAAGPVENTLGTIDVHSPHQTRGLQLAWNAMTATYTSQLPAADRDLTAYSFLSFRVSQAALSPSNPMGQSQDLYVRLNTGGGGPSRAVRAAYFQGIPFPYKPAYAATWVSQEDPNTKAAMKTIRIPLHAWTVKALSAPIVDLTNVESIEFDFMATASGEIEIDDIEFTK